MSSRAGPEHPSQGIDRARQTNTEADTESRHRKALSSPQKTGNAPRPVHQFPREQQIPSWRPRDRSRYLVTSQKGLRNRNRLSLHCRCSMRYPVPALLHELQRGRHGVPHPELDGMGSGGPTEYQRNARQARGFACIATRTQVPLCAVARASLPGRRFLSSERVVAGSEPTLGTRNFDTRREAAPWKETR